VLYHLGDDAFATAVDELGKIFRISVKKILLSQPSELVESAKRFGSFIVVLASVFDSTGRIDNLYQALSAARDAGLMDPKYTWIGAHQISTSSYDWMDKKGPIFGAAAPFKKIFEEMIIFKSSFAPSEAARALWTEELEGGLEELREFVPDLDVTLMKAQEELLLPEFANAFDTLLLAMTLHLQNTTSGNAVIADGGDLEGLRFSCLTGPVELLPDLQRNASANHLVTVFKVSDGLPQVLGTIGVEGDAIDTRSLELQWRDGSTFPGSVAAAGEAEGARRIPSSRSTNGTQNLTICMEVQPQQGGVASLLESTILAGIDAASRQLRDLSLECGPEIDTSELRLQNIDVDPNVVTVASGNSTLEAARASLKCKDAGGRLYILNTESIVETVVPINTANDIVTGSTVLTRPTQQDMPHFRAYFPADEAAHDLVKIAEGFKWNRLALLYDPGDEVFAAAMSEFGAEHGIEVGKFLLSDPAQVGTRMKEFGSAIIVLASLYDFSGSLDNLFAALNSSFVEGLMEDNYVWIGAHQLSTGNYWMGREGASTGPAAHFKKLFEQMLFFKSSFRPTETAKALWEAELDGGLEGLRELVPNLNVSDLKAQEEFLLPEFANAFDSLLLAMEIYSYNYLEDGDADILQEDVWKGTWEHIEFSCLTGLVQVLPNRQRNKSSHIVTVFMVSDGVPKTLGTLDADAAEIDLGSLAFQWPDGSWYPSSTPESDIRPDESGSLSSGAIAMVVALCAAGGLVLLLLAVTVSYLRLRRTLNSIANSQLDLETPIAKACSLLKEISSARIVTRNLKQRALSAAMTLLQSENVHAPDLTNQAQGRNKDILSYLMFSSDTKAHRTEASGGAAAPLAGPPSANSRIADKRNSDGGRLFDPRSRTRSFRKNRYDGLQDEVDIEFMKTAGQDLYFNAFHATKITHGKPLLAVAMQCIYSFELVAALGLDDMSLAAYISFIESGYNDVPYHNSTHAADVVSRTCAILHSDKLFTDLTVRADNILLLSAILAAVVHDFKHPGLSNNFQVATNSEISMEFNEQHVLENMSLNRALTSLRTEEFNFMRSMSKADQKDIYSTVIKLVLATDMSRHFEIVAAFKSKVEPIVADVFSTSKHSSHAKLKQKPGAYDIFKRSSTMMRASAEADQRAEDVVSHRRSTVINQAFLSSLDDKQKILILEMALKVSALRRDPIPRLWGCYL